MQDNVKSPAHLNARRCPFKVWEEVEMVLTLTGLLTRERHQLERWERWRPERPAATAEFSSSSWSWSALSVGRQRPQLRFYPRRQRPVYSQTRSHHFPAAVLKCLISVPRTNRRINSWEINTVWHVWLISANHFLRSTILYGHSKVTFVGSFSQFNIFFFYDELVGNFCFYMILEYVFCDKTWLFFVFFLNEWGFFEIDITSVVMIN